MYFVKQKFSEVLKISNLNKHVNLFHVEKYQMLETGHACFSSFPYCGLVNERWMVSISPVIFEKNKEVIKKIFELGTTTHDISREKYKIGQLCFSANYTFLIAHCFIFLRQLYSIQQNLPTL